jgi:hypothetical protein
MTKKQTRKAKRAQKKPYRIQHRFWLDITRDDEFELDEQLSVEKKRRGFASTLRNALRLWFDLMAGNTDVLCELFPWIEVRLLNGAGGNTDQLIEEFRQMLAASRFDGELPAPPPGYPQMKESGNSPRLIEGAGRKLTVPIDDDDDQDTVILKRSSSTTDANMSLSLNFMDSIMNLQ